MNKKILIASIFATLMLMVPTSSVIGVYDVEEDYGCQVISSRNLVRAERLLARLEIYINIIMLKSRYIPEIQEKCEEILDLINSDFPITCDILESIWNQYKYIADILDDLISEYEDNPIIAGIIIIFLAYPLDQLGFIVLIAGASFDCEWLPPHPP